MSKSPLFPPVLFLSFVFSACEPSVTASSGSDLTEDARGSFTTVITNTKIYGDATAADAVAIRGTAIAQVGVSQDLAARCTNNGCTVVDAKGGFLVPGFHDAHVHLFTAGEENFELVVAGANVARIQAAVRAYASEHQDAWILGRGFSLGGFATLPTAADLDAVEPTRPVAITDHSGHNMWTNTAALTAAHIDASTPDPPAGKIVRDASGKPTGVFLDNAKNLVIAAQPALTEDQRQAYILAGETKALTKGITTMQGGALSLAVAKSYATLDRAGKLRQRAFLWAPLVVNDDLFEQWVAFARSLPKDGKVQVVAFKGLLDGTFPASTAALLAPYSDGPTNKGALYIPQATLDADVIRANRAGIPVALHAVGDAAVRSALDSFERSKRTLGHSLVNRVEHAVVVDPVDVPRFAALGVAASVQPIWLYGQAGSQNFLAAKRLGEGRLSEVYAWNSLAKAGATLLFGSDLPSSDLFDPVTGIYAATFRTFANGEAFTPEQRIEGDLALRAYTENPAAAIGMGDRLGKIAASYQADLVLLDHDPRTGSRSLAEDALRAIWIAGTSIALP
jgi:predicted amidohydrolase YtcJ